MIVVTTGKGKNTREEVNKNCSRLLQTGCSESFLTEFNHPG